VAVLEVREMLIWVVLLVLVNWFIVTIETVIIIIVIIIIIIGNLEDTFISIVDIRHIVSHIFQALQLIFQFLDVLLQRLNFVFVLHLQRTGKLLQLLNSIVFEFALAFQLFDCLFEIGVL
jgi:hypothetical protein